MADFNISKLNEFIDATWDLCVADENNEQLEVDIQSASFSFRKASVNDPFNYSLNNSGSITTDSYFAKGTVLRFWAERETETEIQLAQLGKFVVDNANFDELGMSNNYTLVGYDEKVHNTELCVNLDTNEMVALYDKYVNGADSQEVNIINLNGCVDLAAFVNFQFNYYGKEVPLPKELEKNTIDIQFNGVDFTKYTLDDLLSLFHKLCAKTEFTASDSIETNSILYENVFDDSKRSYSMRGIDYLGFKGDMVNMVLTNIEANADKGILAHTEMSSETKPFEMYFVGGQQAKEDKPDGNGYIIEIPFVLGSKIKNREYNTANFLNIDKNGVISDFVESFENSDLTQKSFRHIFTPETMNYLGHWVYVYDYADDEFLNENGEYEIWSRNEEDFNNSFMFGMPVLNIDLTYDGGFTVEMSSGDAWQTNNTSVAQTSSAGNTVVVSSGSVTDLSGIQNVLNKLQNRINALENNVVDYSNFADYIADTDYLNLGSKLFQSIQSNTITTDYLSAKFAEMDKAQIDELIANEAFISSLITKTATTEYANAIVSKTGLGIITNAMIGDIDTNEITIHSTSGNFQIKDNTLQIKDDNNIVRVQIGKDSTDNYDMILLDEDGKTMFDASGLQANGIKSGIIRDNMVNDDANISASKLNIDSLFTVINEDGTHTLKSSKILFDETGQKLSVVLESLSSNIDSLQDQIDGAVKYYTDLTETPTLDNYPATEFVDWIYPSESLYPEEDLARSTPNYKKYLGAKAYMQDGSKSWTFSAKEDGSYFWRENADTIEASLVSRVTSLELDADGFRTSIGSLTQQVTSQGSAVTQLQSDILQTQEEISLRVTKEVYNSGMATKVNSAEIIASINASTEASTVKIKADRIQLDGTAVFNSISSQMGAYVKGTDIYKKGTTTIDGGRIDTDSLFSQDITATGKLTSPNIYLKDGVYATVKTGSSEGYAEAKFISFSNTVPIHESTDKVNYTLNYYSNVMTITPLVLGSIGKLNLCSKFEGSIDVDNEIVGNVLVANNLIKAKCINVNDYIQCDNSLNAKTLYENGIPICDKYGNQLATETVTINVNANISGGYNVASDIPTKDGYTCVGIISAWFEQEQLLVRGISGKTIFYKNLTNNGVTSHLTFTALYKKG